MKALHRRFELSVQDKFYLLFEQEVQIWPKRVVSKVAMQFTSTTYNTCELEEIVKSLSDLNIPCAFFQFKMKSIKKPERNRAFASFLAKLL